MTDRPSTSDRPSIAGPRRLDALRVVQQSVGLGRHREPTIGSATGGSAGGCGSSGCGTGDGCGGGDASALGDPGDDPLAAIRGGVTGKLFVLLLGALAIFWMMTSQARATNEREVIVKVHGDLADDTRLLAAYGLTPPVPDVQDVTPTDRPLAAEDANAGDTSPMPASEDITPRDRDADAGDTPPMPAAEDITPSDRNANAGGTPPMPAAEDITPRDRNADAGDTPPKPAAEDITPSDRVRGGGANADRAPPIPPVEDLNAGEQEDAFGTKRTKTGSLVIEDEDQDIKVGIDAATAQELEDGNFFDPEAFSDAKTVKKKAYVHLMPGIPNTVFFGSAILVLLISFFLFERYGNDKDPRSRVRNYWRIDLMAKPWAARMVKSRWFQPAVQIPVVIGFVVILAIGLIGSQEPGRNLAPVLTWNIWWIGLIFVVFVFGNLWCFMCPWTAIPDWIMRLSFTGTKPIRSLGKRYPRAKLWMWPAIILFAFVTWLEIIFDAANRPWLTSVLAISMVVQAWALLVLFERKVMCRYVCFVGRVSGQYSMLGLLELRRRDEQTCKTCVDKECYHGVPGKSLPCPTHEFMGAMNENQYCTLCTECVKSCPHDNISFGVRAVGDVMRPHRSKPDEAYMAILVFIVSAFHGAAMIPLWKEWETIVRQSVIDFQTSIFGSDVLGFAGSHGGTLTFTLMMLGCIFIPSIIYYGLCWMMARASGRPDISRRRVFIRFSFTLLPIALFYHLAHNATHVFWEWSKVRRLVSDPLGWGHDIFGTARAPLSSVWSPETIWYLQIALVIIGHILGIVAAQREAFRLYDGDKKASFRVHLVMMAGMALMSLLSLWLLAQPMYMRTADI